MSTEPGGPTVSLGYVLQKLFQAVHILSTSHASLRRRLEAAGKCLVILRADSFPDDLRERFVRVMTALCDLAPEEVPGEGTIAASTRALGEADANRLAEEIFDIFFGVAQRDPWHMYHEQNTP